jgi:hypothetical protein
MTIYEEITKLYTESGFFTRYAGEFWFTIVICIIVFIICSYYWVINNTQPILDDWSNQRCNPAIIPFAGLINAPSDKSALQFTSENFEYCTQTILGNIAQYALSPIYYVMNINTVILNDVNESINSIRGMFDKVRGSVSDQGTDLFGRSLNIMMPLIYVIRKIEAIFGKAQGALTSGIYTLYGGYITMQSSMLFMYESSVSVLWIIFSFIIICFSVGWLFPPTLAAGLSAAAFLSLLLIPIVIFIVIMGSINDVSGLSSPPPVPGYCFSGNTKMETNKGIVELKDLNLGDKLKNGSVVTATMQSTSRGSNLYNLNGVIVTGCHKVFEKERGWIDVAYHSQSRPIVFDEPYVYCIGTNHKTIEINEMIFSDWDEMEDDEILRLKNNTSLNLPTHFSRYDIHTYLDIGMHPDTVIKLKNGRETKLKHLNVNDVLLYGEKVMTIVKVKTDDVNEFCDILYKGNILLSATKNTHVTHVNLNEDLIWQRTSPPKECYHIITDCLGFRTDTLFIGDYNSGIDRHL